MPLELFYGIMISWIILLIIKRLKLKIGLLENVLWLLVATAFIIDYFDVFSMPADWLIYASGVGFLITLVLFSPGDVLMKDRHLKKNQKLNSENKQLIVRSESLRKRFIAMIELLKDGLAFKSDDGMMFANDSLMTMIGFNNNEFSQIDYEAKIHPDDLTMYQNTLRKLTKKKATYEITYRFKKDQKYIWLKEHGTLIHYEDRTMIINLVKSVDVRQYPETEVDILNRLKIDHEMLEHLQSLNRMRKEYYLVFIELSNIPAINRKYGRDIGDLMMGEFLNKMRFNFVKEDQSYFRLSGIRFAMVVKDERKYEILERALKHGGEALNFAMNFGGIEETIFPSFGIQKITVFDEPIDELIERTMKALDIALSDNTHENYFIMGK